MMCGGGEAAAVAVFSCPFSPVDTAADDLAGYSAGDAQWDESPAQANKQAQCDQQGDGEVDVDKPANAEFLRCFTQIPERNIDQQGQRQKRCRYGQVQRVDQGVLH